MLFVLVPFHDAQRMRSFLKARNVLVENIRTIKEDGMVGFPISERIEFDGYEAVIVERDVRVDRAPRSIREMLAPRLGDRIGLLKSGFDVIGEVAIMEVSEGLEDETVMIGEAILALNTHVRSVYVKDGIHSGEYRIQPVRFVCGIDDPVTVHRENGYRLKLDVTKTYFSPRVAGERMRIANLIKQGEKVLVLFSGIAPYGICIAKHAWPGSVVCVELNEDAHQAAVENVRINKVRVECVHADAHAYLESCDERFDRIILPLPKDAEGFLASLRKVSHEGTMIHCYAFAKEEEIEHVARRIAGDGLVHVEKVGQNAPGKYRICVDVRSQVTSFHHP